MSGQFRILAMFYQTPGIPGFEKNQNNPVSNSKSEADFGGGLSLGPMLEP